MIVEILNYTTSNRIEPIHVTVDDRTFVENVFVNTFLGNKNVDDHIDKLKEACLDEPNDLILLVVKYIPPTNKPDGMENYWWETWIETSKNLWGFKIVNRNKWELVGSDETT